MSDRRCVVCVYCVGEMEKWDGMMMINLMCLTFCLHGERLGVCMANDT